ncbi:type II secretion system protein [Amycolatopsis magusensis]|uniref:type II secretion system protein n=1 Tax=Amycolatopsis magusensis TaxID=882444 RepID=UPI0037985936
MSTVAQLIALAIGVAVGLTAAVTAFVPARPRLSDVLRPAGATVKPLGHVALKLAGRLNLATPSRELELAGTSQEAFVLQRIAFALGGAVWIPLLSAILAVAGAAPPLPLTATASLGAAVIGWTLPNSLLKAKARQACAEFKGALAAYCQLVALGRLGDRGPAEALRFPATLGNGAGFQRIRSAMDEAVLRGEMPWNGLQRLADRTGVRELKDLGHIITDAGAGGASIADTLRAKGASLVRQQLAEQRRGSSIRSDRMDMPVALMGLAFITFLAFPGLYTMLAM